MSASADRARNHDDVCVDLAAAHRIMVLESLHEGTWNHLSVKVPGKKGHLYFSPASTHFSRVTASSLVETDRRGGTVGGGSRAPNRSAWAIHQPVHDARPEIACVLHVHPPYATALASMAEWRLNERGSQLATNFFENIAYSSYGGVVTESTEGERLAEALGHKRALMMANHGVLVVGMSVEHALLYLVALERACHTEWLVASAGGRLTQVPVDVARRMGARDDGFGELGYLAAMKEVLDAAGQDYAA